MIDMSISDDPVVFNQNIGHGTIKKQNKIKENLLKIGNVLYAQSRVNYLHACLPFVWSFRFESGQLFETRRDLAVELT